MQEGRKGPAHETPLGGAVPTYLDSRQMCVHERIKKNDLPSLPIKGSLPAVSVKKYPVLRPGSPFFTGKSGFGVVGIGFGMARGGGKIG